MSRLARLPLHHIALACAVWAAFVILLPQLTMLALSLGFRVRAMLSPERNYAVAFGGAHWTSWQGMMVALLVPPTILVAAWLISRFMFRGSDP